MLSVLPRVVAGVGALFFIVAGVWALADPQSFYDTLAEWPPYNEHFLHDVGAFQLGLGATLLIALRARDGLFVALAGASVGAVAHAIAHFIDQGEGGKDTDAPFMAVVAVLLIVGAVIRYRQEKGI